MKINLEEIATGWFNLITGKERENAEMKLKTCFECNHNSTPKNIKVTSYCLLCSCPLKAKTRNPDSECPADKW